MKEFKRSVDVFCIIGKGLGVLEGTSMDNFLQGTEMYFFYSVAAYGFPASLSTQLSIYFFE